jgi:hypothetical protein
MQNTLPQKQNSHEKKNERKINRGDQRVGEQRRQKKECRGKDGKAK